MSFEVVSLDADPVRIYRITEYGTYSVADESGWYPGIYASEAAARFAPQLWQVLAERTHWQVRGMGADYRPVTLEELREWAAEAVER